MNSEKYDTFTVIILINYLTHIKNHYGVSNTIWNESENDYMAEKQTTKQEQSTKNTSTPQGEQVHNPSKRRNKGRKRNYRPRRQCPYCYEKVDIERKGSILICYTCGNDS